MKKNRTDDIPTEDLTADDVTEIYERVMNDPMQKALMEFFEKEFIKKYPELGSPPSRDAEDTAMISHAAEDLVDALYKEIARQNAEIECLKAKLVEYESAPVRIRHIGEHTEYTQGVHDRLRHIMKTGRMPDEDDPR